MTLIRPNRRTFLKSSFGVAATAAAARIALPGGAWAATPTPEVTGAKLGYIALTDSAPLIIAVEKGLFAKHGMPDVVVEKQASWGATRDNMALGSANGGIDGGHILRPKVHLYATGKVMQNNQPLPMYTLLGLNEDCQGLSVAQAHAETGVGLDSSPLKEVFAAKKASGAEVPVAMTFPGGTHDLWMRYWLAAGGIDPTKDVDLIVVPPPQMVANMKVGNMEAFCVGEPWNEQLVNQGIGLTAATTGELWKLHPEKVLGMRADWVDANPNATIALGVRPTQPVTIAANVSRPNARTLHTTVQNMASDCAAACMTNPAVIMISLAKRVYDGQATFQQAPQGDRRVGTKVSS